MADKEMTKKDIEAAVKADHAKRETPEQQHYKGVAERLKQAIKDEAEKN